MPVVRLSVKLNVRWVDGGPLATALDAAIGFSLQTYWLTLLRPADAAAAVTSGRRRKDDSATSGVMCARRHACD